MYSGCYRSTVHVGDEGRPEAIQNPEAVDKRTHAIEGGRDRLTPGELVERFAVGRADRLAVSDEFVAPPI